MNRNLTPAQRNAILSQIREGMDVVDAQGEKVGSVNFVHMADENARLGDASTPDDDEGLIEEVAEAFVGPNDYEVTERMLQFGYVKIDAAGIFTGDVYVQPAQIAAVTAEGVSLSVVKDNIGHPS